MAQNTMATDAVEDMLLQGQAAMTSARQQVKELARLECGNGHAGQGCSLVEELNRNLEQAANAMEAMTRQWEGFQARYRVGERIIKAQEEERQRVAREIHDGPAQSMANVVLRAEICERLLAAGRQEVTQELAQLKMLVKESLREVRKIIFNLRPMALDDLGLVPTLYRFFENMREQDGTIVGLEVVGEERRLSSTLEVALFRMIQEAVNNARKHAQASKIEVRLEFGAHEMSACVHDDGIGFDMEAVKRAWHERQSFGLMSMRERIQLLNGEFEVVSNQKGGGTTIMAHLPIVDAEDRES